MTHGADSKHSSQVKRIGLIGALLVSFLLTGIQSPQAQVVPAAKKTNSRSKKRHKRVKRPAKIDGYITLSSYYDDNVFQYSDSDITLFVNSTAPLERFPINQINDVVTSVAARGDIVWNRKRRSFWRMRFRYDASLYQRNTFRHNNQFGVELRRKNRHSYTEVSFLWMPNYYLRHLYWSRTAASLLRTSTTPRYVAANLSKVGFYVEYERRLVRRLYGRLTIGYTHKNYGAPFDERDNSTFSVVGRLRKIVSHRVEVYIRSSVASVKSSASDYNTVGIADIGNTEVAFKGGFKAKLDKRGKFLWSESFSYAHQSYNTSDSADVFHYNRSDNEIVWTSRLTWRAYSHLQPRLFYSFRKSTSTVQPGVNDVGAYTSNRSGIQIIYYF